MARNLSAEGDDMNWREFLVSVPMILSLTIQPSYSEAREERYLCLQEVATGFSFDENLKKWKEAVFYPEKKYIVAISKDRDRPYQITEVGHKMPSGYCEKGFPEEELSCEIRDGQFKFSKTTGRFIVSYMNGYYMAGPGGRFADGSFFGTDTPYIAIGKCSPF